MLANFRIKREAQHMLHNFFGKLEIRIIHVKIKRDPPVLVAEGIVGERGMKHKNLQVPANEVNSESPYIVHKWEWSEGQTVQLSSNLQQKHQFDVKKWNFVLQRLPQGNSHMLCLVIPPQMRARSQNSQPRRMQSDWFGFGNPA